MCRTGSELSLRLRPLFVSIAVPSRPSRLLWINRSTDLLSLSLSPLADDEAYAHHHGDASSTSPSASLRPKCLIKISTDFSIVYFAVCFAVAYPVFASDYHSSHRRKEPTKANSSPLLTQQTKTEFCDFQLQSISLIAHSNPDERKHEHPRS